MDAVALVARLQQELDAHPEVAELRAHVLLSFNRKTLIILFRHPETGYASAFDAGFVADILDDEKRLVDHIIKRLKGRGTDKPFNTAVAQTLP